MGESSVRDLVQLGPGPILPTLERRERFLQARAEAIDVAVHARRVRPAQLRQEPPEDDFLQDAAAPEPGFRVLVE